MILSDRSVRELISKGELLIEPLREENIQASSVDLTLGSELLLYRAECVDIKDSHIPVERINIPEEGFLIPPKAFLLATTEEYIKLPEDITAFVEGRSSLGRLGLFIENAGWVDAGFEGQITLELYNANNCPIRIYKGVRICQIVLARLDKKAERPYRGKYQGQKGATPSRIYLDFG
ncbi:MAG: dCTP deaminase [Aquificaceae bacterium]|nr:dCTP deaminase [Aquificaceae bacterium]MCS7308079.1 dCTP deaminase [Aquificaceae bacterium]MCX8075503.1 dCTP deaminase [Aquificaceae bacterium]MDW8433510.1 dCTP deaminase [Aquificaceae bacterium]